MKRWCILIALMSSTVHADMLGVQDTALLLKAIEQANTLYKQLETIEKTYKTTVEQYQATQSIVNKAEAQLATIKNLNDKNSGHYGFGELHNSVADLRRLQWSADRWSDSLKGDYKSSQYKSLVDAWQSHHKAPDTALFSKGARGEVVQNYEQSLAVNRAAGAQSEYTLNEINERLARIHTLSGQIEKAENTKASVDLNSRLLTELAYLQTQNLKSQSLINQQLAQKQAVELSERGAQSDYLAFDDE